MRPFIIDLNLESSSQCQTTRGKCIMWKALYIKDIKKWRNIYLQKYDLFCLLLLEVGDYKQQNNVGGKKLSAKISQISVKIHNIQRNITSITVLSKQEKFIITIKAKQSVSVSSDWCAENREQCKTTGIMKLVRAVSCYLAIAGKISPTIHKQHMEQTNEQFSVMTPYNCLALPLFFQHNAQRYLLLFCSEQCLLRVTMATKLFQEGLRRSIEQFVDVCGI